MSTRTATPILIAALSVALVGGVAAEAATRPFEPLVTREAPGHAQEVSQLAHRLDCINRRDKADADSPLFHGCSHWAAAVGAHYALYAATRLTGDTRFADQPEVNLDYTLFSAELATLKRRGATAPSVNMYGYGWLLLTALEREQVTGRTDLRPMAGWAASQLASRLPAAKPLDPGFSSSAFATIALHRWAARTGDAQLLSVARRYTVSTIKPAAATCRPDEKVQGFLPGCLMSLAAVAEVERDAAAQWLEQRLAGFRLRYVDSRRLTEGQRPWNFLRVFAGAVVAGVTGSESLRADAVAAAGKQMDESWAWRDDYAQRSRWVPQTGVLAFAELRAHGDAEVDPTR